MILGDEEVFPIAQVFLADILKNWRYFKSYFQKKYFSKCYYEGNLDVEELLNQIIALDKYFNYEDVEEDKKVKHAITRLKGHATLWWDELQANRHCKGKQRIKIWDSMVAKNKSKFIPIDY